jgi:hypothetical protein
MRHITWYTRGGFGSLTLPAPGWYAADESVDSLFGYPGHDAKVDLASLRPGGMTK